MFAMIIAGALFLTAAASVASSDEKRTLPYDEKLLGTDGYPIYVDDATIKSTIPWLKNAQERLSTCHQSMTLPEGFHVEFAPTVTGAHTGEANTLDCDHTVGTDHFECLGKRADRKVHFDDKPDRYFTIEPGTGIEDALGKL